MVSLSKIAVAVVDFDLVEWQVLAGAMAPN
jgi:hypothetical protein